MCCSPRTLRAGNAAGLHSTDVQEEVRSVSPMKKRCLRKDEVVELCRCLLSIKPLLSIRMRLGVVGCPGIVKSTPLLQQTAISLTRFLSHSLQLS